MRNIVLLIISTILFVGCDPSDAPLGYGRRIDIENVSFTIDTYESTNTTLIVNGTITNIGIDTIHAVWYIEALFYTDSTYQFVLGPSNTYKYYPLLPNTTTDWSLGIIDHDGLDNSDLIRIDGLRAHY